MIDFARKAVRRQIHLIARVADQLSGGKLTPFIVTTIGLAMHLPVAVLIARGDLLWAAVLLIIFGLFDVLDGELARLQGSASPRGMIYDATTDRIKEVMIFSGIAYWLTTNNHAQWAFMAAIACGASITLPYAKAKGEVALALKGTITDHHTLNRHFDEGLAPFEVIITIVLIGLITNQLLAATSLIAVLSSISVFSCLRVISRQL